MVKKIKTLTKLTTKISTRTMLLVALGLAIVAGFAAGIAPLVGNKTTFNIAEAGLYTGENPYIGIYSAPTTKSTGQLVSSVVYAGQGGSGNSAVATICSALKIKGVIKYEIDYTKSKAVNIRAGYCPRRGSLAYQAYDVNAGKFFQGSCWGGHNIYIYYTVNCAAKAPYIPPYTAPYTKPSYTTPYTSPKNNSNLIAPSGVRVSNPTANSVTLVWDNNINAKSYEIWRSDGNNKNFTKIAHKNTSAYPNYSWVSSKQKKFIDQIRIKENTIYFYKIRYYNKDGSVSEFSKTILVMTPSGRMFWGPR